METTARGAFPNELWIKIVEYLRFRLQPFQNPQADRDIRSALHGLSSLARVNRNFNAIATPPLYHTLPISSNFVSSFELALTLIARPDLAQLVQEARINEDGMRSQKLFDTLVASVKTCRPDSEHAPFLDLLLGRARWRNASTVRHMALFLFLLPHLRVAELDVEDTSEQMLTILDAWPGKILSRVEELRLRHPSYTKLELMRSRGLGFLIRLPCVRTFHDMGAGWKGFQGGPKLELRHVVLGGYLHTHIDIRRILSQCAHLETLKIDTELSLFRPFDFSLVGEYLRDLGKNLEELDLGSTTTLRFGDFKGSLGSLYTLDRLKRLSVWWDMMAKDFRVAGDVRDEPGSMGGYLPAELAALFPLHPGIAKGGSGAVVPPVPNLIDHLPSSLEHLVLYLDLFILSNRQLLMVVQSDRLSRLKSVRVIHHWKRNELGRRHVEFQQDLARLGWNARKFTETRYNGYYSPLRIEGMVLEKRRA